MQIEIPSKFSWESFLLEVIKNSPSRSTQATGGRCGLQETSQRKYGVQAGQEERREAQTAGVRPAEETTRNPKQHQQQPGPGQRGRDRGDAAQ